MNLETNGTPSRRGLAQENFHKEVLKHMAPKEQPLGLGPLVEQKRWKYGIIDAAWFGQSAAFDRVLVWQVSESESGDFYEGTKIAKTEVTKKRELVEAPRGVIVSAGLSALDVLRSNGMDIGHTIGFTRLAPFRRPIGTFLGERLTLVVLHVGDIVDSEDLGAQLKARKVRIVPHKAESGLVEHRFVDEKAQPWTPVGADTPEDA